MSAAKSTEREGEDVPEIGQRILAACHAKGITQNQAEVLWKGAGRRGYLSRVIRGHREPTVEDGLRLAEILGVEPDWLWRNVGPMQRRHIQTRPHTQRDMDAMIQEANQKVAEKKQLSHPARSEGGSGGEKRTGRRTK